MFFPPSNWKKKRLWFLFCFVLLNGHYYRKDRLWGDYQKPSFRHANFEMSLAIRQNTQWVVGDVGSDCEAES